MWGFFSPINVDYGSLIVISAEIGELDRKRCIEMNILSIFVIV
jgi:hypothetical protein